MFCPNCGAPCADIAQWCSQCGAPLHVQWPPPSHEQPPYNQPPYPPPYSGYYRDVNRIAVGLLGIFLGSLGIHKFYLGQTNRGILYLCLSVGGFVLGLAFSWLILPVLLIFAPCVMGVIGLVEGITYLCMDEYIFRERYCRYY